MTKKGGENEEQVVGRCKNYEKGGENEEKDFPTDEWRE